MKEEMQDLKDLINLLVELYQNIHLNDPDENVRLNIVVDLQIKNLLSIAEMINSESVDVLLKVGFDYEKAIGKPLNHLFANTIEVLYQ